jgi:hypothetical protein
MMTVFLTKHKTIEYGVGGKSTCICRNPIASYKGWTVGIWIAASRKRLTAFIVKIKESVINEVT